MADKQRKLNPQNENYKKHLFQYTATPEQLHENARQAGLASAAQRKKYKRQGEILRQILTLPCDDPTAVEQLQELGLDPDFANAANLAVIRKALRGDVEAMRYVRDTLGEKPADTTRLDVLSKPVGAQDLTQLSDAELEMLADIAEEEEGRLLTSPKTAAALPDPDQQEEPAYAENGKS